MSRIKEGYYIKARCIQNSWIAHASPVVRETWDYLLRIANHKDKKYNGFIVKRGQTFKSYREIRNALKWRVGYRFMRYHESSMKRGMVLLRREGMIELTNEPRGNLITVLNYDKYQDPKNYERTTEKTNERTNGGPTADQLRSAINKNDKNDKNVIKNTASSHDDGVQKIFDIFYNTVNPTISFGNTTSRKAAQNLIKQFGLERILKITKYSCKVQSEQFAPTITTPYQLKEKMAQLKIFADKQKSKKIQSL